jgi:hypothetical protein
MPKVRALPRSARQAVELDRRSAPLREAQATNWLFLAAEASRCFGSQKSQAPENSTSSTSFGLGIVFIFEFGIRDG